MTTRNPYANIGHTRSQHKVAKYVAPNTQALATDAHLPSLTSLFRHSPIITVQAQVQDYTLAWAGRISCSLVLSTGHRISLHINRDKLPPEIGDGDWVHAKLLLGRGADSDHTLLQATTASVGSTDPTTAWLPVAAYLRNGHMHKLRALLSRMEPALQAIFMGVMSQMRVQQGFFSRIGAADHHGYPGGLFDYSVQAARTAWSQTPLSARERGIAALSCLLFDLGKVSDEWLRPDRERLQRALHPHPMTVPIVTKTLVHVKRMDADLVNQVHALLEGVAGGAGKGSPGIPPTLAQCVYAALVNTWALNVLCGGSAEVSQGGQA
jgi:hypothetical protein